MTNIKGTLHIDALYRNTNDWNKEADQFNKFFRFGDGKGINNVSGFRPKSKAVGGSTDILNCAFCVIVTNFGEVGWPDTLDKETGLFTYYGDNREPGPTLKTVVGGNQLLEAVFEKMHKNKRELVPPFLCFESVKTSDGAHMRFLGLAAPGAASLSSIDDLVGVWRLRNNQRFQNYRAIFTVLREEMIAKPWLEDLVNGTPPAESSICPPTWQHWVKSGLYDPLECKQQAQPRSKKEQLPVNADERRILNAVFSQLTDREFEFAAAELVRLLDKNFTGLTVTQRVKDGGRDVLGNYVVGHASHHVRLSVAIEAKQWKLTSAIGVKPMMRLISRLKHRDIGAFVTTSFFDPQVQAELIEDSHPVLLVAGGDIARLLLSKELGDEVALAQWIDSIRIKAKL